MTEKRFALILLLASALRVVFDTLLMNVGFWPNFFNFFYLFVLYFSIVSFVHFTLTSRLSTTVSNSRQLFLGYAPYWLLLFPAVPVVTYLTGSSYSICIPFFSNIPTFMVERNYLPTGMLFIIPLMFLSFLLNCRHLLTIHSVKLLLLLAIIFTVDYLLLYQWGLRAMYFLNDAYSIHTALSIYGLFTFSWGYIFIRYAVNQLELSVWWLRGWAFVCYTFLFLLFWRICLYLLN